MLFRLSLCGLATATLWLGCSTPQVIVYPLIDLDEQSPVAHVDVYPHPDSLQRPHREIAIISATDSEHVYTIEEEHPELIEALTEKARKIGADAIVIFQSREATAPRVSSALPEHSTKPKKLNYRERRGQFG